MDSSNDPWAINDRTQEHFLELAKWGSNGCR